MIQRSTQSLYASATVVVRKKDSEGNYTDFRQCGDYRPLNLETNLDRYPLPGIEDIFNQMGGATVFSKLDLRSGYHQMPLREEDRCKTAFWGANRVLWEWPVVPFGLKNAPPYFQVGSTPRGTARLPLLQVLHRRHRRMVLVPGGAHGTSGGSLPASEGDRSECTSREVRLRRK